MKNIKQLYAENKEEIVFVLKIISFFLLWKLFEHVIGEEKTPIQERFFPTLSYHWELLNDWLRMLLLQGAAAYFNIIDCQWQIINRYSLWVIDYGEVRLGNYCIGVKLCFLYTTLFISYKSTIKRKLLFITSGILAINVLNITRIILLLYTLKYWPQYLDFNHDYVFNGGIYLFSFLMFALFLKKRVAPGNTQPLEKQ